jgi:hypothetical protein
MSLQLSQEIAQPHNTPLPSPQLYLVYLIWDMESKIIEEQIGWVRNIIKSKESI